MTAPLIIIALIVVVNVVIAVAMYRQASKPKKRDEK